MTARLEEYLERPIERPAPEVLDAIQDPIAPADALHLGAIDRLIDRDPVAAENGWCRLPDGTAYVAIRTPMPAVTGEMIDWWFDWHPRDSIRYRVWHPLAHAANSLEPLAAPRAKAHWGAVHHPVEDIGIGMVRARIAFKSPTEMGMSTDALEHPEVATIVCGYAGDDSRHIQHTPMFHVFLREGGGVVLRSRFWLGAALRPYGPLGAAARPLLNRPTIRRLALPAEAPRALAAHCAEEYANLGVLLPELYELFGPGELLRN